MFDVEGADHTHDTFAYGIDDGPTVRDVNAAGAPVGLKREGDFQSPAEVRV